MHKSGVKLLLPLILGLIIGSVLLVISPTENSGQGPPNEQDFFEVAPQGLDGDRHNGWAWSMVWWKDHLYVGTNYNFHCAEVLSQNRNLLGSVPYPPNDPDVECPEDPLQLDMRAEIWRWQPLHDSWERVYKSPVNLVTSYTRITGTIVPLDVFMETVTIPETEVAQDIGYRGMVVFEEPDGTQALYVTAISAKFAGYPVPPPRLLRSTDGVTFEAVPQAPGTLLGELDFTSLRNPIVHQGSDGVKRLYVTAGSSKGSGVLLEAERPWEGNNSFRQVNPDALKVSAAASFNGFLYLGIRDTKHGFSVIKMDADGGPVLYPYTTIIEKGGYAPTNQPNVEVLSMQPFKGSLYIGGNGIKIGTIGGSNTPAELFRINPDDTWDLIAGDVRLITPVGSKFPLSGYEAGFGNEFNGHMWRMAVHNEHLYIGTFDGSTALKDQVPSPPQPFLDDMGFDLYWTADGVTLSEITDDGFSSRINDLTPPRPELVPGAFDFGARSMVSTPHGLFVGTANYYYGLRIWRKIEASVPSPDIIYVPIVFKGL